jgi:hypothetical protein
VEETSGIVAVRTDPTDRRSEMNQHLRAMVGIEPLHLLAMAQIVLTASGDEDFGRTVRS